MVRASFFCAVLVVASSCAEPLVPCELNATPGLVYDLYECPLNCYEDIDGDGIGGELIATFKPDSCPTDSVPQGGDCDDTDAGAWPGNREVCDGLDNDCNGLADFDVEHEEEQLPGSFVYSCTPPNTSLQLFILGGSFLQVEGDAEPQTIDSSTSDVKVRPGATVTGLVKLRTLVPAGLEDLIGGGVAVSWFPEHEDSFTEAWNPVDDPENQPEAGWTDYEFEVGPFEAPQKAVGADANNAHYLTVAGGMTPRAEFIGSLTGAFYCYRPGEWVGGDPLCEASWDGIPDIPGGPVVAPDRDLADLDELDLAGCRLFGAARLPTLVEALTPDGEPCSVEDNVPGEPPCVGFYANNTAGCMFVKMVVEEEEEAR